MPVGKNGHMSVYFPLIEGNRRSDQVLKIRKADTISPPNPCKRGLNINLKRSSTQKGKLYFFVASVIVAADF